MGRRDVPTKSPTSAGSTVVHVSGSCAIEPQLAVMGLLALSVQVLALIGSSGVQYENVVALDTSGPAAALAVLDPIERAARVGVQDRPRGAAVHGRQVLLGCAHGSSVAEDGVGGQAAGLRCGR